MKASGLFNMVYDDALYERYEGGESIRKDLQNLNRIEKDLKDGANAS